MCPRLRNEMLMGKVGKENRNKFEGKARSGLYVISIDYK
jgi:hypothetical protein